MTGVGLAYRVICALALAGLAAAVNAQPTVLRSTRIDGRECVAVGEVAHFYHLGNNRSTAIDTADYHTDSASLGLEADHRYSEINGVQHWLSVAPVLAGGRLWITRTDVLKEIDPVLRPQQFHGGTPLRLVVIDPGHGGRDRGTRGHLAPNEKDLTLDLAKRIERELAGSGLRVTLTRRDDETVPLEARVELARANRASLFVSVHFNAGFGSARGVETYCLPPAGASSTASPRLRDQDTEHVAANQYDAQNVWLAHCIQKGVRQAAATEDRGVKRARFLVLREANCPAILVEAGFLSDRVEEHNILTTSYRDLLAKGVADGILNYRRSME